MKQKIAACMLLIFVLLFINASPARASEKKASTAADAFEVLKELMDRTGSEVNKKVTAASDIQKFVSLYSKFYHRPQLLTEEVLFLMYNNYEKYNILVDFIEKIPIREPETVIKLFAWVKNFQWFSNSDKALFNASFQSLFELFSHAAKYAPDHYDYDALVGKLIDIIPFDRSGFYDQLFAFFKTGLNIQRNKKDLIDFALEGINNTILNIDNIDYQFVIKDVYKKQINEILESQQACSLSTLLEINELFDRLLAERKNLTAVTKILDRLDELILTRLPYAEISKEAPKHIRERVMAYSKDRLEKDWKRLSGKIIRIADLSEIKAGIKKIKKDYLVHQLSNHLLTLAYALNAKNPKLRIFLNPNMVRLHDFVGQKDRTAWNYCGAPPVTDYLSGHYLVGGLSRLSIAFAAKWYEHLFSRTYIYDSAQLQSLLVNLLEHYPVPRGRQNVAYDALMVDFGLDLMRKSRQDSENQDADETMRKDIIAELSTITAGYHYRKALDYLSGKAKDHNLFFSELKQLGEIFFKKGKYLEGSAPPPSHAPAAGIYYHTFGNLNPQPFRMFPQDVSNIFAAGWVSGEMIEEFKIKLHWHLYKRNVPPILLGQVLHTFLRRTASKFFSQNHANDYVSTYFMFKIFNNSHLRGVIKRLQKEGYLKLK